jgi:ligand-binding sensor domain-containing protein/serine phosphatase RsbU (regulator of sigma subunit)
MSKKAGFFSRLFYLYLIGMRILWPKIIGFIFFIAIFLRSEAQTYNFKNYNTDQGLAQSQVLSVFQDSKGYMWFGTNSGGLSKFDGNRFQTITSSDGLIDNEVFSIIENNRHELLFGTTKGLSVFNGFSFQNFGEKEGLKSPVIKKLLFDGKKTWIGTENGVFTFENNTIKAFNEDSILSNSTVWNIFKDKDENLWFATFQNGVVYYNTKNKNFKHFGTSQGLTNDFVFSIGQMDNGSILVGTQTGLNIITKSFVVSPVNQLKNNINISFSNIFNKGKNVFYFGTFSEGLLEYNFNTNSIKAYNATNGLTNNIILPLLKDREGNLWVGTAGNGVYKYYNDKFIYYTKESGLPNNFVDAVSEDSNGNLWLAINGRGLTRINGKTHTNFKADFKSTNSLPDNAVKAILPVENGKIYFGTESGLCLFSNEKFYSIHNQLFDKKYIQSLYKDSKGKIWIGTNEGVFSISHDSIQEEKVINSFRKEGLLFLILFITEDAQGNLLIGLENGLINYSNNKAVLINDKAGFVKSKVSSGIKDFKGNIWFGTADGLYIYANKLFKKIVKPNGSGFGFVTFLQTDRKNHLVIGTNNSIEVLNLKAYYHGTMLVKHIGKEDGLLSKESNFNASTLDKWGRILIGTSNGLEIYDPTLDFNNANEAQTTITEVQLFFGLENIRDYSSSDDSVTLLPKDLVLPYLKNNLSFHFIGISLITPEKVKYKYKLNGLDKNWTPADNKTEAIYTAIPPGNYTFMVQAMNNDGLWNKVPTGFEFRILPPWYKTWWFRFLAAFIVLMITWLYIRFREKQLVKDKEGLEKTVLERTAKISEQKNLIEEKNKEIVDSINYAQRIQKALLASEKTLQDNLPQHFVFFQPKDVVSGDFYWASLLSNGQFVIATADSTGHGVPGAIMSMLNISCLNDSVEAKRLVQPKDILNNTRLRIIDHLANDGSKEGGKDGMDCSLVSFDFKNLKITYSAANNPVWMIRLNNGKKEFIELSYDKMPVGKHDRDKISFTQNTVDLQKGDLVYTLTDGLPDQFGGTKGKKFMYKKLKDLLVTISELSLDEQKSVIAKTLSDWKGNLEQVDDILIIGVRV